MFDSSLLTYLRSDSELASYLSTSVISGLTVPSVFSNKAPEGTQFNYVVFSIHSSGGDYAAMETFTILIDIFGYSLSGVEVRDAVKRITKLLDRQHLSHEDYATIRIFLEGKDFIETGDIKSQHYNVRFTARAGRSGWMSDL
jgi:hypothetical protein